MLNLNSYIQHTLLSRCIVLCVVLSGVFLYAQAASAATLSLTPPTGVYSVGGTFSARVVVNTGGKPINAAEGELTYNPKELQVVGVSKGGSIFSLWTIEPKYSGGKISFGGGSPSGYTGSNGTVVSITFRALGAGTPKVNFTSGSVLAADGQGTNVLSSMQGGTYTVNAATAVPEPEYIAPANTPGMPDITSSTHPDPDAWYTNTTAKLSWGLPSGVTAVRMLLDESRGTIPTNVYEPPIREKELTELEGVSYFHLQFKNADGWGKVAHYRLAVDAVRPESFDITLESGDETNPKQRLIFNAKDAGSGVAYYMVQIDGGERAKWVDEQKDGVYELPLLDPGDHTVVVEAIDHAGNGLVASISFTVEAFEAPIFTDYPSEISERIIPVVKGTTRPRAHVFVSLHKRGAGEDEVMAIEREVTANDNGEFTFVADGRLAIGSYEVTARAVDEQGAQSLLSDPISIAVQESVIKSAGATLITILSVTVPLVALIVLLILLVLYGRNRIRSLRSRVIKETLEAERSVSLEIGGVIDDINERIEALGVGRKGKITKSEIALLDAIQKEIVEVRNRVEKEVKDIERAAKS